MFRSVGLAAIAMIGVAVLPAGCTSVEELAEDLGSAAVSERREAARGLWEEGEDAEPATAALIAALDDDDDDVRMYAAMAIGEIGPPAARAAPALTRVVQREDFGLIFSPRYQAALALARIGPAGHGAIPVLVGILRDEPGETLLCSGVGLALQRMGRPAIPALARLLAHPSREVGWAPLTLAGFPEELWPEVVAAVRPLLFASDERVAVRALVVVGKYAVEGSEQARRVVAGASREATPRVQREAAGVLAELE